MVAISTYVPLATVTLAASSSSVTFSGIPTSDADGNFRDLILIVKTTSATDSNIRLTFNGDTSSSYSYLGVGGNGSSASSVIGTRANVLTAFSGYTNHFEQIQIMDFTASNKHKMVLCRGESAGEWATMVTNRWANTAAISSITVLSDEAAWSAGSTFSLYALHG